MRMGVGVETANFLDELAVAGLTGISDDNAIVRVLLGTVTCKANLYCHEDELLLLKLFITRCRH